MTMRLSWSDFTAAVLVLARLLPADARALYGVPRGGLPLAVALSHRTGLPLAGVPRAGVVLVDEIADSGRTLAALREQHGPLPAVAWVKRETTTGDVIAALTLPDTRWVIFPWECPEWAETEAREYAGRK